MDFFVTYIETLGILDTGIMIIINITINNISKDVSFWYDDSHTLITFMDDVPEEFIKMVNGNYDIIIQKIRNIIPSRYDELSDIII